MVARWRGGTRPPVGVSNLDDGFAGASEIKGTINIPHWKGGVKVEEVLGVGRIWGDK